jgi:hypothetical protein
VASRSGQFIVIAIAALGATLAASGCLSADDTSAQPGPGYDGGTTVTPLPDANVIVDSASPVVDASKDSAAPSVDAGHAPDGAVTAIPSTIGLVGGGTLSRSANYTLVGATGPATAPPLQSPKFQLTGGVTVTK